MKKLLLTTILTCSCFIISIAQQEKNNEQNQTNVRSSKATLKEKSTESLSSPKKVSGGAQESVSIEGDAKRTKAVVNKTSEKLNIEGVPEGVSMESEEAYKTSKAKWKADHPEKYKEMMKSRKTIIEKSDFDNLPPEKKGVILKNPDLYEITE